MTFGFDFWKTISDYPDIMKAFACGLKDVGCAVITYPSPTSKTPESYPFSEITNGPVIGNIFRCFLDDL